MLLCALLLLYVLTRSHHHHLDALDYAAAARSGHDLFHPHHLLYNAFGSLILRLVDGDALAVLATVNALVTIGTVGLVFILARHLSGRADVALLLAAGYSLTHGIWHMATTVECYPITLLAELATLLVIARGERRIFTAVVAGVLSALAMLFHQTAIFFMLVPGVLLWRRSRGACLAYLLVAGSLTLGAYLLVVSQLGAPSLLRFMTTYAHADQFATGTWGGGLRTGRAFLSPVGFLAAIVSPRFVENMKGFSPYRPSMAELAPLFAVVASIALYVRVLRTRGARRPRDEWDLALGLWAGALAAFTAWWEPTNYEFWLLTLPPLTLLVARRAAGVDLASPGRRAEAVAATGLLLVGNLLCRFVPDARSDDNGWLGAALALERNGLRDGDLVISDEPAVASYVRYFDHKTVVWASLDRVGTDATARDAYRARIDEARHQRRAYLLETDVRAAPDGERFYAPDLAGAEAIARYSAYGHGWNVYRLR